MTERRQTVRFAIVAMALAAIWTGLGVRLAYLHLGDNETMRVRVQRMHNVEKKMLVGRGRILDRNGSIMALDLELKHVFVDPEIILGDGHQGFIAYQLARVLELDPAMVASKINRPGRRFEYVKNFVHDEEVQTVKELGFDGVHFEDVSARHYPRGRLASHVLGFANLEGVGSAGIEQKYDRYLRGVPGLRVTQKDGTGREIYVRRAVNIQPQEGSDIVLTLDQNLQHFVEKALDRTMERCEAKGAWAIVQHVRSGDILAMASRPTFDLNDFRKADNEQKLNRAIGYVYEPGSTFKVGVYAAAFNEGLIDPDQIVDCENGTWFYKGRSLRDYHPHGKLSYADALKKSSNIAAAKVAIMLGEQRLHEYISAFGFGKATGIRLPGEEIGILHPVKEWDSLSISRIPMGHGIAATSLQLVSMLSAIGNNGFVMKPRIVREIASADGETVTRNPEEVVSRPIRGDTARLMCRLLARITESGGTARRAGIEGYTVAGKTGTAQKVLPGGGYSDELNISSFMGLIPAESPQLSIIVVVDEPADDMTGGQAAAPAFKEIADQAVHYLDIPPVSEDLAMQFKAIYEH